MRKYTKTIGGKTVIKRANEIVVEKDGKKWYSPTQKMLLDDGWTLYVKPKPTEKQKLAQTKAQKKSEIRAHDSSSAVNEFFIGELPVWLDKATRAGLMLRFQAEIASGKETTTLWYGSAQFSLPLSMAMQMLYGLELYASACYDNTQAHLAAVDGLTTIEEVEAYDFTTAYPEKLRF